MGKSLYGKPMPKAPAPPKAPTASLDGMSKGSAYPFHKPPTPSVQPNTAILPLLPASVPHQNYDHAAAKPTGSMRKGC